MHQTETGGTPLSRKKIFSAFPNVFKFISFLSIEVKNKKAFDYVLSL